MTSLHRGQFQTGNGAKRWKTEKNLESVIVIENDYFNYACECERECVGV